MVVRKYLKFIRVVGFLKFSCFYGASVISEIAVLSQTNWLRSVTFFMCLMA